ncbi:Methylmalonyl-CoA mutase [Lacunisphaera limnophila]|uniref:Methylmalonyl-CoA mutase n=1 Tax=Lacunisphaera limnophila TaxID=1838286 RepID=A0A1D8AVF1_9BACT|nr:methylmalonyl-CoA mutase family protein [Lacunisphaera limnophila]AOS44863.1 Methylmalonyl-CoA mutase [Lacunisphaera limnophila]
MKNTTTTPLFAEFPPPAPTDWRRLAEESLEGAPFDKKLVTRTPEGIDLQPIYTRADAGYAAGEWPGLPPFGRGADALGARAQSWRVCQELPYGVPEEFNAALLMDLNRGQNAVNLIFDIATRLGLDPQEARPGEVGGCGLSLATLDDLVRALRGVDLAAVPVYAPAGVSALPITAMFVAALAEQGKPASVLHGGILSDPYSEWLGGGVLPCQLASAFDDMAAVTDWAARSGSALRTVGVAANHWADAGGSAVHELAFGLATGVDYLRALGDRHITAGRAAPRFLFTFSSGSHFFMEVAKFRAARLLWARAVTAAGAPAESARMVCHARTSLWNKTALDPHVNLLRTTTEAFAAVIGGCASLHVAPFDECHKVPDDFSRRLARNIQLILAEECQLGRVVDPAGGSWYVESLTRQLAAKAWAQFQEVEKRGGMAAAIRAGYPQETVDRLAAERLTAVESRRDGIIGTNLHPNLKERAPESNLPDYDELAARRIRQVAAYRQATPCERDVEVMSRLDQLLTATPATKMKLLTDAFAHGATLGEVGKVLGIGRTAETMVPRLRSRRRSEPFEALRRRADAFATNTGARPSVFLANFGPRKQHAARADFTAGFFAAGGFEAKSNPGFDTPQAAAAAAQAAGARLVVICSTDETYPALVPVLAGLLKAGPNPPQVVLAGLPATPELQQQYRQAGVDEFIHIRANCAQLLSRFQEKLGF